jgi:hypothetical protein
MNAQTVVLGAKGWQPSIRRGATKSLFHAGDTKAGRRCGYLVTKARFDEKSRSTRLSRFESVCAKLFGQFVYDV